MIIINYIRKKIYKKKTQSSMSNIKEEQFETIDLGTCQNVGYNLL
jgi:hypothetical protein